MSRPLVALIAVLILLETAGRLIGLGHTLVYEKTEYGYRVVPGQSIVRFGNRVSYNEFGLRSEPVPRFPPAGTVRVLCLGDSITFGGTFTDQGDTYPYQLEKSFNAGHGLPRLEVLNASAGGWALENEAGWLEANGTMGAHWVLLQMATHDLFQERTASDVVGRHPSFPERQPLFALEELAVRYILPRFVQLVDPGQAPSNRSLPHVQRALASIGRIATVVRRYNAALVVLFVEQPRGLEPADELTNRAKDLLFARLRELRVPLIRPAETMERAGGARLFRDSLHPNADGNRILAEHAARVMQSWLVPSVATDAQRPSAFEIRTDAGAP